jgi:hypothetical protein
MVSNRIPPLVRSFFTTTTTIGRTDKDSSSHQGGAGGQPDRDATEEEAKRALELLSSSEEFQKNALSAELSMAPGFPLIVVKNASGMILRSLRGKEILRLLEARPREGTHTGRLLDRRI